MKTRRNRRLALATATAIGLLTAGACSQPGTTGAPPPTQPIATPNLSLAAALKQFESCDNVMQTIRDEAGKRVTAYGLGGYDGTVTVDSATAGPVSPRVRPASPTTTSPSGAPAAEANKSAGAADQSGGAVAQGEAAPAPAHSGTNVQEVGVDEPDLIKTDGKKLFALTNGVLHSFNIVDGVPRPAGTLDLSNRAGSGEQQLLQAGDKLLVLTKGVANTVGGATTRRAIVEDEDVVRGGGSTGVGTQLVEIDASDLANMKQTSQITIDGNVVDARLVNNTARVVLESAPGALDFVQPKSSTKKAQEAAKIANKRIIDDTTTDDWFPQYTVAGSTDRRPLVECQNVSHPQQFGGFGMVTVLTVEIGKGINPKNSVAIQADADKVYATKDRLFVSTNRAPEPVETTTPTTVTGGPPTTRVLCDPACPPPPDNGRVAPKRAAQTTEIKTSIHEFDITGNGPAVYRASGEVRGHLLNDFAMSSRNGFLRVATIDQSANSGRSESYVSVLNEEAGELKKVGEVGGMGKGEQIKSVRFIGNTGYVVTFRQTDPLYTVDVSDPRNPKVVGELKILGYSAYLHPINDSLLLGVGQDATDRGRALGTQVSLFDVSNPAEPKQLQKVTLPNARSDAEADYHAFLYWDPTKLAMIPVESFAGGGVAPCPPDADCAARPSSQAFVGAVGFTVDASGIKELGYVINPLPTGTTTPPVCPTAGPCEPRGNIVPGPTVTTTTPLPTDPQALEACRRAGACPPDSGAKPTGVGGGVPSTTTTTSQVQCITAPCPGEPIPPTTICAPDQCTGPSTTTTSTTAPSTTTSTTVPKTECDPMCPVPPIDGTRGAPIDRAVVVGDKIYTLSSNGILVSELSSLKALGWVPFSK